jgi:protein phosphatase
MGDSRIYCLTQSSFKQITNDHTLTDGRKLTRCIGIGNVINAESYPAISGKCRILICSDGLTDMVGDSEIENVMKVSERTADAANTFLGLALKNGGRDNITLIVADINAHRTPLFRGILNKLKG